MVTRREAVGALVLGQVGISSINDPLPPPVTVNDLSQEDIAMVKAALRAAIGVEKQLREALALFGETVDG